MIEEMLVKSGRMTREQLSRAQALIGNRREKERIKLLADLGYASEAEIIDCICRKEGGEPVNLEKISVDSRAAALLPASFAREHCLLPLAMKEEELLVASPFWTDRDVLDEAAVLAGTQVRGVPAPLPHLKRAIERAYGRKTEEETQAEAKSAPLIRMVNGMIEDAYKRNASDIHVEPGKDQLAVYFRINGDRILVKALELSWHSPVVTRLKLMAGMDIACKRLPQDGKYHYERGGIVTDLRISSLPTIYGEKIALRLLGDNRDPELMDLRRLGMGREQRESFERMLRAPYGLILVTGPTGSGKSTTLYAALNRLASGNINIITVEDPVEKLIPGITQVQINPKAGLTFASALRSILRQDPDVIMVGEMRDEETVSIGVRAAITGHRVFSTLHTGDCASAILRLRSMGVPSYLIADALTGVVAQRLIKLLCPHCRRREKADSRQKKAFKRLTGQETEYVWRAHGCGQCGGTGYIRRRAVYEMMEADRNIKEMIREGAGTADLRLYQRKKGMASLDAYAAEMLLAGETDIEEAEKIIYSAQ